ncbi:MAG TPA: phosphoribosylanthranilate isomerase [Methanobacterium sp.]|nr:phosphoribosylanthranilate isomerase [Methanobacterium sp.]
MQVKICGITNSDDLKTCENHDAAFIGFINVKRSKRFRDVEEINELTNEMKNPQKAVLVLEPRTVDEVLDKTEKCGIKNVQLHSLAPDEICQIKNINVIRAIGIPEKIDDSKKNEIEEFARVCNCLLFDFEVSGKSGGTGKQIPLEVAEIAAETAKIINPDINLILAGGMNTERMKNEGKTIEKIFDYVDVNSGVENSPGIKNKSKISEFMMTCR